MPLVDVQLHVLIRLIHFVRCLLRLHFADDLLENFQRFQTAFAFVTLDVQFHAPVGSDRNVKFALRHDFVSGQSSVVRCPLSVTPRASRIPMPHLQPDGLILVDLFLHDYKLARANFIKQTLMDIFLDHALA